ncbi:MAG: hypothetical protein H6538_03010 [Bacteroidales bacterium]|nr:hypothetical protein [Bacteroidales bacterium]
MKTKIYFFVLTAILSLTTISAFADGTKGKKEKSQKAKTTIVTDFISNIKDAEMEVESWMTSIKEFHSNTVVFYEAPLQLEDWMMESFSMNNETENFQDDELILENWMLESFDVKSQETFTDKELELESWMLEIM